MYIEVHQNDCNLEKADSDRCTARHLNGQTNEQRDLKSILLSSADVSRHLTSFPSS